MRLVIPGLFDVPCSEAGGVATYTFAPGATFAIYPLVALPADLAAWGAQVVDVGAGARVVQVFERATELGWPATLAESEVVDPATGAVIEHRFHVMYRFLEYGGIAIARAREAGAFKQLLETIGPLLPHGRPDFTSDEAVALAQVWAYL